MARRKANRSAENPSAPTEPRATPGTTSEVSSAQSTDVPVQGPATPTTDTPTTDTARTGPQRTDLPRAESAGIPSTAAIRGHPIHPLLIPLPITLLLLPLFTDLGYWGTDDEFWARASLWLLGAGVITAIVAAIAGAVDYFTIERARQHAVGRIHAGGNVIALLLGAINWWIRMDNPVEAIMPWGIVLSAIIALLLLLTGWAGGELVYRHKIGVIGPHRD